VWHCTLETLPFEAGRACKLVRSLSALPCSITHDRHAMGTPLSSQTGQKIWGQLVGKADALTPKKAPPTPKTTARCTLSTLHAVASAVGRSMTISTTITTSKSNAPPAYQRQSSPLAGQTCDYLPYFLPRLLIFLPRLLIFFCFRSAATHLVAHVTGTPGMTFRNDFPLGRAHAL